jgi:hypothetical protein
MMKPFPGICAAIGGTIGTGIFLSAGSVSVALLSCERVLYYHFDSFAKAIALAGPGSALLSYFVVGVFVYSVVISLYVSDIASLCSN